MGVNLKGVFYTCKACLDIMLRQQRGRIVNMASIAAHRRGGVANTIYATSKSGVISLRKGWPRKWVPEESMLMPSLLQILKRR